MLKKELWPVYWFSDGKYLANIRLQCFLKKIKSSNKLSGIHNNTAIFFSVDKEDKFVQTNTFVRGDLSLYKTNYNKVNTHWKS